MQIVAMSLTGLPLLFVVALGTVAVAAGTVLAWRRRLRPRLLVRPLGILLTEALLVTTIGLLVNRSELFYPTWADLFPPPAATAAVTVRVAALDGWLGTRDSGTFTWRPDGWAGWHLAAAPTVVVPAGYLGDPHRRFSVVVVLGAGGTGTAAGADETVVVYARTTAATPAAVLTEDLPAALSRDLRVSGRRWALVSPTAASALAGQAAAAPGRYPAIALVRDGPITRPVVPEGVTVNVLDGLPAALAWAAGQTPPPLAEASAPAGRLPVQPAHHPSHPAPADPSHPAPANPGGNRGPGQPGN
ncbi:MAG TPA: hypothetical protein VN408_32195 [Actinoplanes sp.]|nr:hypothetical protein [Actinoplanes sp.]